MGIMSLIRWSFLLSAALTFFQPQVSSQSCKQYIFIADFNSSYVRTTACNFSSYTHNQSLSTAFPLIMNQCFRNLSELGICFIGISNYNWNETKPKEEYKIYLDDVSGLTLRFIQNASRLLPSQTFTNAGYPQFINVTLKDLCIKSYNQEQCAGRNYIVHVQQNRITVCKNCIPPTPDPSTPCPSSSLPDSSKRNISEAIQFMDNLSLIAKSMSTSSLPVTKGKATGLIQKQDKDANVDIGYTQNQKMETLNGTLQETELLWSVKIPAEAFNVAHSKLNETPFVGVMLFPDLDMGGVNVLKDEIFGISMGVNITNLINTIDIYFRLEQKNNSVMTCNSWDGAEFDEKMKPKWTTSGCDTNITGKTIKCSCTHLTFFAILMAPPGQAISAGDVTSLTYITSIGCGLSTFFLLVGLFIHFVMWRSKSRLGTTILMNLFVALCLLNITFLSNQQVTNTNNNAACIIIAAVMHFSMLATFSWFFIQGLHFYLNLNAVNMRTRKYKLAFIALGWGFPALVVIVIAASGNYTYLANVQMCWNRNIYIHYIVNVGYYALVFIFTLIIFIMIVQKITQARFMKNNTVKKASKKIAAIFSLTVLLGLTWGVAFFSYGAMAIASYYIFSILNSFQGFFLFLYYYYFRNDDMELNQSASNTTLSLQKPTNVSSTMTSGPETEIEYN
ncbi:hypothetical protein AOLI_G00125400 [Acnodon oligacanthus]